MTIVQKINEEVSELKLKGHLEETNADNTYIRVMELLERQAKIIQILAEIDPSYLTRFHVRDYRP